MDSAARKTIAASMIGNVIEWYDFAIYGNFAAAIGRNFFPRQDAIAQLIAAFGVFAIGYLMRPLGGAVIGYIGDYYSRRTALNVSVTAMAAPTVLTGLLPGYETLGLIAPVALILLRTIQGLSAGGEYISSVVFMVERAPFGHRRWREFVNWSVLPRREKPNRGLRTLASLARLPEPWPILAGCTASPAGETLTSYAPAIPRNQ